MARYLLLTIAFLLAGLAASAQTSLQGTVTDAETGEPIIFGTVAIYKNDVLITGTETDFDGFFSLTELDAGTYDVVFSYTGYQDQKVTGVIVSSGKSNQLDTKISAGITITTVEVVYERPLVSKDETTQGKVFSAEDIQNLPTRNVNALASLGAGASSADDGAAINIRGSRANGTNYYIDGVRVFGNSVPTQYIEELQVITGGIEAKYGDVTGGVISITTKGPSDKFSGGLELETSEGLDPYGHRLASLNLSGPIWKNKGQTILGYRIGGQYRYNKDDDPPATTVYRAKDEYVELIEQNPVRLIGETLLPEARFATNENVNALDYNPFEERTTIDFNGKLDANLGKNIDVTLSGTYNDVDNMFTPGSSTTPYWTVFNSHNNPTTNTTRYFGNFRFRHRLGTTTALASDQDAAKRGSLIQNAVYTLQFGYEKSKSNTEDPRHKDNLFNYGYIGSWDLDWVVATDSIDVIQHDNYEWTNQNGVTNTLPFVFEQFTLQTDPSRMLGPGGYVPNPTINPVLANYNFNAEDLTRYDDFGFRNGQVQSNLVTNWSGHFANVGTVYNSFSKNESDIYTFNANTSFELVPGGSGGTRHNIQFGILYEQRVQRGYSLNPRYLWVAAELLANQHLEGAALDSSNVIGTYNGFYQLTTIDTVTGQPVILVDENNVTQSFTDYEYPLYALNPIIDEESESKFLYEVRNTNGTPIYSYFNVHELDPSQLSLDMFSARELNDQRGTGRINMDYFGYDYLGNPVDNVSFDDFFTAEENGIRTFPVAPNRPNYQAAFIQDKFTYKDIIFRVGLRVDRFDANTKVLKDPYSLYEVQSARNFTSTEHPGNIGDEFKVYVTSDDGDAVKAYRDDDTWYFPNGTPANSGAEIFGGSSVFPAYAHPEEVRNVTTKGFDTNVSFEDYTPQVNWMPRLAFSFPISDEANFFAHYDVLVQRPPSNSRFSPLTYFYWESSGSTLRNNANLKPERTIDYEVGFQQKLSNSSAIKMSAYYKELRDMIQSRWFVQAAPVTEYETFDNLDFATIKGFNLSYDLRRTGNLSLNLAYTLQFADGTGSNATTSRGLSSRGIQRALFPMSYDERHRLTGIIDYRYGSGKGYNGPRISGVDILANTGLNITTFAVSGRPYTAAIESNPFGASGNRGSLNGSRLPWSFRVDARLDKSFDLSKPGAKRAMGLNVYLRVSNLFDRRNILGVYRATGSPTDDGYLKTDEGKTLLASDQFQNTDGTIDFALRNAFESSYGWRLLNPNNFSLPRRIFVGAIVNF